VRLDLSLRISAELETLARKRTARELAKEIESGAKHIEARLEERDGVLHVAIESDRGTRVVPVKGKR
jgi:hypothetical protein